MCGVIGGVVLCVDGSEEWFCVWSACMVDWRGFIILHLRIFTIEPINSESVSKISQRLYLKLNS